MDLFTSRILKIDTLIVDTGRYAFSVANSSSRAQQLVKAQIFCLTPSINHTSGRWLVSQHPIQWYAVPPFPGKPTEARGQTSHDHFLFISLWPLVLVLFLETSSLIQLLSLLVSLSRISLSLLAPLLSALYIAPIRYWDVIPHSLLLASVDSMASSGMWYS